ncbi:MAG: ferrochelatase [Rhodospirillales bacterium]|nr:ferrochelatase [Rhodospirillales bacterium]MSP80614.1 ferrochelatase [Rhodospirillales bacterium]
MSRVAVVLFNLGGPDRPEAVRPFLFNLFNDPAIISVPWPIRPLLAWLIARRRAPIARAIYAHLGGGSPLLPLTRKQADALEARLKIDGMDARAFVCMRYWQPMSAEVAREVAAWTPERVVLLPLYPQLSTTTTESSLRDWVGAAATAGLDRPAHTICCYPSAAGFIEALAELTRKALAEATRAGLTPRASNNAPLSGRAGKPRVLFSAHGLPLRVVARGDPYPRQVETTAAAVAEKLGLASGEWVICYQSRVGPLKWIGPSTEDEIARAGADRVPIVVVPIAFVSEHSETLVELDIEYRHRAEKAGVPGYVRVPAVGTHPLFIVGLAGLVREALRQPPGVCRAGSAHGCGNHFARCANGRALDSL